MLGFKSHAMIINVRRGSISRLWSLVGQFCLLPVYVLIPSDRN